MLIDFLRNPAANIRLLQISKDYKLAGSCARSYGLPAATNAWHRSKFMEDFAFELGWIDAQQLKQRAQQFGKNNYGSYLDGLSYWRAVRLTLQILMPRHGLCFALYRKGLCPPKSALQSCWR